MDYEWDPAKARANLELHGVDFADAVIALEDELGLVRDDPDSEGEERFVSIGMDAYSRILVTVFTHRVDRIRLISSRKATRLERHRYEET